MVKIKHAKKIFKNIALITVPVILITSIFILYDHYLDIQISNRYNAALGRTYGVDEMNKGIKLLEHNAEKDDLIILGSSELDSKVPQNPQNMFPNTELNCDVDLVGRACVQSLLNSVKMGALRSAFKDKKVVFIVSPQWFLGEDIDQSGFKAHFSEIQFYKFMDNNNIDHSNKLYMCNRIENLLKNDSSFERPYLYAYLYKKDNIISNLSLICMKPYYILRTKFLALKDKHMAFKKIKEFEDCPIRDTVKIDWQNEYIKAEQTGKDECTNNDFYVYDEYYTTYLADKIKDLKNSSDPNLDLCASKEFNDYKLLLNIFNQTGIKPYIIFTSANGFYYDYIGLDRNKRIHLYDNLKKLSDEYKFEYLDLREKEYTPYFYRDIMHLGRKGWLYVNEQIINHYS